MCRLAKFYLRKSLYKSEIDACYSSCCTRGDDWMFPGTRQLWRGREWVCVLIGSLTSLPAHLSDFMPKLAPSISPLTDQSSWCVDLLYAFFKRGGDHPWKFQKHDFEIAVYLKILPSRTTWQLALFRGLRTLGAHVLTTLKKSE